MDLSTNHALRPTGLLGGSFDPVHHVHLALARMALHTLNLVEVQFIPAAQPWQRGALGASPAQRLAMLQLAIANEPGLTVNSVEIDRGGPTYTIDTLRALPSPAPGAPRPVWILGSDQLVNFCTWHAWRDIVERVDLAVAVRPGSDAQPPAELAALLHPASGPARLHTLPLDPQALSATDIRQRVAQGLSIDSLTPAPVVDYIRTHHLYSSL